MGGTSFDVSDSKGCTGWASAKTVVWASSLNTFSSCELSPKLNLKGSMSGAEEEDYPTVRLL